MIVYCVCDYHETGANRYFPTRREALLNKCTDGSVERIVIESPITRRIACLLLNHEAFVIETTTIQEGNDED
jgi:hypothetical protein